LPGGSNHYERDACCAGGILDFRRETTKHAGAAGRVRRNIRFAIGHRLSLNAVVAIDAGFACGMLAHQFRSLPQLTACVTTLFPNNTWPNESHPALCFKFRLHRFLYTIVKEKLATWRKELLSPTAGNKASKQGVNIINAGYIRVGTLSAPMSHGQLPFRVQQFPVLTSPHDTHRFPATSRH